MGPRVARRLEREHLVGQRREVVAPAAVADADEVDVAVYEPWQDGAVAVVVLLERRALRRSYGLLGADGPDRTVLQQHGAAFEWRASSAIDHPRRLDQLETHGQYPPAVGARLRVLHAGLDGRRQ